MQNEAKLGALFGAPSTASFPRSASTTTSFVPTPPLPGFQICNRGEAILDPNSDEVDTRCNSCCNTSGRRYLGTDRVSLTIPTSVMSSGNSVFRGYELSCMCKDDDKNMLSYTTGSPILKAMNAVTNTNTKTNTNTMMTTAKFVNPSTKSPSSNPSSYLNTRLSGPPVQASSFYSYPSQNFRS